MENNLLFLYQRRLSSLLTHMEIEDYCEDWSRQEVSFLIRGPVDIGDTTIARIKDLLCADLLVLTPTGSSLKVVAHGCNFPLVN